MPNAPVSPKPRRGLRVWVDCVLFYGIVVLFGICGMLEAVVGAVLYLLLPRRIGIRFGRWLNLGLFCLFVWGIRAARLVYPDLKALDALRDQKGIIIAPPNRSIFAFAIVTWSGADRNRSTSDAS